MKKIWKLKNNDSVSIISLSSGVLGESFCEHQVKIGTKRLEDFSLKVKFTPNALKGLKYINENPDKRANDLIWAIKNNEIRLILCAIGGNDTYRTIPYLLDNDYNKKIISSMNKIFLGYSDTTINHLMFNNLNVPTFYGQAFLTDLAELDFEMLNYSKTAFKFLFSENKITYKPSEFWYEERKQFGIEELNTSRKIHKEEYGYISLQGKEKFQGILIGGCLESIADLFIDENKKDINKKYNLFTQNCNFKGKVLLLETSELKLEPIKIKTMLEFIEKTNCFNELEGVLIGKPQNEAFFDEYKEIFSSFFKKFPNLSVVYNLNVGHSYPKMILQLLGKIEIDVKKQEITTYKA
ncbi:S66 family peptidase [Mycoplasmopsis maculosa]|nr:S66 peptidase family protein [Mycoplasmopsis maculosa]